MKKFLILIGIVISTFFIYTTKTKAAGITGEGVTIGATGLDTDNGFIYFSNSTENSFINIVYPSSSNNLTYANYLVGYRGSAIDSISSVTNSLGGSNSGVLKYSSSYKKYFDSTLNNKDIGFGKGISGINGDFSFGYAQVSSSGELQIRVYLKPNVSGLITWQTYATSDGFLIGGKSQSIEVATSNLSSSLSRFDTYSTQAKQDETNEKLDETNETLKDSNVSEANESANSFFNDFESDDFGLSDIITLPLTFIEGLSSGTCNDLNLPVPFVDQNIVLPCMTEIYEEHFGDFLTLYQLITTGFISYWVCVNVFRMVQNFKSPDNDEIEVLDL